MRVLHLSPTDTEGGAAKGAYQLHSALRSVGVDSLMLVQRKYGDDPSVLTLGRSNGMLADKLRDNLDRLPLRFFKWKRQNWWTVGWLPFDISSRVDQINPDIVHLHWVGRGAAPVECLARLGRRPLVWTLRDMWPLTGGCHYSVGCTKFLSGCGACPLLRSARRRDISSMLWRRKYRAWNGVEVTYIALSNWMADLARRSPLTFGNDVTVIPTGIDTRRFAPVDRQTARAIWGLPADRKIIMYGSLHPSTTDPRKGFLYLRDALRILASQGWDKRAKVVVFGANDANQQTGMEMHYAGRLNDHVSLALLYSCADVMVVPSTEENLGKTALEAMSCGVPVAAFANTGQFDIVDHKVNGYLAENLSSADLAQGIAWCLEQTEMGDELGRRARLKVLNCFDIREAVKQHVALYRRVIEARRKVEDHSPSVPERTAQFAGGHS